jgi:hypothetical protein
MTTPLWHQKTNFASALLLHTCVTVSRKELSNSLTTNHRLTSRRKDTTRPASSVILDGYTSIRSRDYDGELTELHFTNTGMLILLASLITSISMNLLLPTFALNLLVALTFVLASVASTLMARRRKSSIMPVMALRRAGRFI